MVFHIVSNNPKLKGGLIGGTSQAYGGQGQECSSREVLGWWRALAKQAPRWWGAMVYASEHSWLPQGNGAGRAGRSPSRS